MCTSSYSRQPLKQGEGDAMRRKEEWGGVEGNGETQRRREIKVKGRGHNVGGLAGRRMGEMGIKRLRGLL